MIRIVCFSGDYGRDWTSGSSDKAYPAADRHMVRERRSGGRAEVVHCHLLFHLAHPFLAAGGRSRSRAALERLIDRHGRGNYADHTLKLTFPRNPNGVYLLKGGGPDVWQAFGVPMSWRKPQGLIVGKRCGSTENIGPAARERCRNRLHQVARPIASRRRSSGSSAAT